MRYLSILLVFSLIVIVSFSSISGQEQEITPTLAPEDAPAPLDSSAPLEEDGQKFPDFKYLIVVIISLFVLAGVFLTLRVRKKLSEANEQRKPLTGLASKHAGMISPDDKSKN